MLMLLPPSEGKTAPRRGAPLDLSGLGFPELTAARTRVLDALVKVSSGNAAKAASTLGLSPSQLGLLDLNASLAEAPAARADRVYSGVLYDALDLASLEGAARRRAASRVLITSALFGLVRPTDRIPAYRLSGDVVLPRLGAVAGVWRAALPEVAADAVGSGLLIDLRSSMYAAFWRPPRELAPQVATVRVLHEVNGKRQVVSHFNKATKGRIVRALLEDGATPATPEALATTLTRLGWGVELGTPTTRGTQIDVVVSEL